MTHARKARRTVTKLIPIVFALLSFYISTAEALEIGPNSVARIDRTDRRRLIVHLEFPNMVLSDQQALGITSQEPAAVQQALINHVNLCIGTSALPTPTSCDYLDRPVLWNLSRKPVAQDTNQVALNDDVVSSNVYVEQVLSDITGTAYSYKMDVVITNSAEDYTTDKTVLIRVFPDGQNPVLTKDAPRKMIISSGVKTPVTVKGISSTKGTIILYVDNPSSVTFEDGTTAAPTGVQVLLVPNMSAAPIAFPTKVYVADPVADPTITDNGCTIATTDNTTCTINCSGTGASYTLALDQTLPPGGQKQTVTNLYEQQAVNFSNLTIDDGPYGLIYSYLPEGTGVGCSLASPSDAVTFLQVETGNVPKEGDPSCFIATAAYGSPLDSRIDALRWFRDSYLITNDIGRAFVKAYYRNSPPLANWIAERPNVRTVVRGALWLPVVLIEFWRDQPLLLILAFLLPLPMLMLYRRRKTA